MRELNGSDARIPGRLRRETGQVAAQGPWWRWETCPACGGPVTGPGGRCRDRECNWPGDRAHVPTRRYSDEQLAQMRARASRRSSRKQAKQSRARNR